MKKSRNIKLAHIASSKEEIGYMGAHGRVYRKYGKASNYECELCTNIAKEWALMKRAKNYLQGME